MFKSIFRKHLSTCSGLAMGVAAAVVVLVVVPGDAVQAQPAGGNGHRPPPAEALAACKSLASGAACSFTSPHGSVTGSCFAPQGRELACRPANAPAPGRAASGPRSGNSK